MQNARKARNKKKTRTNSGAKLNKKLTLTNKRSAAHTGRIRDTTADQSCNQFGNASGLVGEWETVEVARQTNVCQENALRKGATTYKT